MVLTTDNVKVGLIGFGMMGQALGQGMMAKRILSPGNLMAADLFQDFDELGWVQEYGIKTTRNNLECVEYSDIVLLCVKPFFADEVLDALVKAGVDCSGKVIVSLISGYSIARIKSAGIGTNRIIRIMPNTAALVGEASTALSCSPECTLEDKKLVKEIMSAVGGCWEIPERRMNIWTAVAGAGPAYVFQFIEALKDSAVAGGIPHNIATEMAVQVVLGSAKMALEAPNTHLAQLRDNVCSPAGVTVCGLQGLQEGAFTGTIMKAIERAKQRYDAVEADPNI